MGGLGSAYGIEVRGIKDFGGKLKERDHLGGFWWKIEGKRPLGRILVEN
jgi:hypothetical protein